MIDFHCHIDLYPNPQAVVGECVKADLDVLSVTTTPSAWSGTLALAQGAPRIHTALGFHPQLVGQRKHEIDQFEGLLPSTRFVGEIGLDGSLELRASWSDQCRLFERMLNACDMLGGRVMSIHSRRASGPVLDELARKGRKGTAILHWFSGSASELARAIELGCWFSVGLPMLMAAKGRALVSRMPRERVLTETDGPFVEQDGKHVLPWQVSEVSVALSAVWQVPSDEVDRQLTSNLSNLLSHQ